MIDLHLHSSISLDGELSPKALIDLCYEQELKVLEVFTPFLNKLNIAP